MKSFRSVRFHVRPFEEGGAVESAPTEPTSPPEQKQEAPKPEPKPKPKPEPEETNDTVARGRNPVEKEEDVPEVEQEKDVVRDILDKLFGPAPKVVSNFIKAHGDKKITAIQICRKPIEAAVSKLMDVVTLGKFSSVKNKIGYDRFYHLFMNITLEGGKRFKLEKNQLVKISGPESASDCITVSVKPVTLAEAFKRGIAKVGKEKFWRYSALSTNCQHFVAAFLSGSGMYTSSVKKFVYQPLDQLVKELPAFSKKTARKVTDVASYLDTFIQWATGGRIALKKGIILKTQ